MCVCVCACVWGGIRIYINILFKKYTHTHTHTHTHTGMNIPSSVSEKLLVKVASGENCRKYTIVGRLTFHHMLF